MKRGTPDHPKTYELMAHLEIPRYAAVGLLESLWHFAQHYAQAGDIGRHTDEAIARALDWKGSAGTLMSAFAKAGWVDRCSCHRARVHDWPNHADQTVKRALARSNQAFLRCYQVASSDLARDETAKPSLAEPGLAVPSPAVPTEGRAEYVNAIWAEFLRITGRPETELLGTLEYGLAVKWWDQEIPLATVLTAMKESPKGKDARRLTYFGPSVQEAAERRRKALGAA